MRTEVQPKTPKITPKVSIFNLFLIWIKVLKNIFPTLFSITELLILFSSFLFQACFLSWIVWFYCVVCLAIYMHNKVWMLFFCLMILAWFQVNQPICDLVSSFPSFVCLLGACSSPRTLLTEDHSNTHNVFLIFIYLFPAPLIFLNLLTYN